MNLFRPAVTVSFIVAAITCALAIMCYTEFAPTPTPTLTPTATIRTS